MWARATAAEDVDAMAHPLLHLEPAHQGCIAVLRRGPRRDQCRLQALSGPPAGNFAEGSQCITAAFPVIWQRTQEALDLLRGAAAPDDPPLAARKRLLRRRLSERGHGPTTSNPSQAMPAKRKIRDWGIGTGDWRSKPVVTSPQSPIPIPVAMGGCPCPPVSPRSRRPKKSASI